MTEPRSVEALFEPIRIGPKVLKNRFYQVPHNPRFGTGRPVAHERYLALRAEGGWAAVCTGYAPVNQEADHGIGGVSSRMWDDGDVELFAPICQAIHEHGALAGIELHHAGVYQMNDLRVPAVGPSQLSGDWSLGRFAVPRALDAVDIRRIQGDWAQAAKRARAAGFDIVYVYGAHGFLPMQFLSPYYNKRTDEYGGAFRNRARFWLETLELVREAIEGECALACRISVDEVSVGTVGLAEALEFIRLSDDLVDLWDVNVSSIAEWAKDAGSSRFYREGYQVEWTHGVRTATSKPIVGVSRWSDPDRMVAALADGYIDLIGCARSAIADPFLPAKIQTGRVRDVRRCVGGNECLARTTMLNHLGCVQNPTAGEEFRRGWHPEHFAPVNDTARRVVIVGAGPAGLECASVLARRGLESVHVIDAADVPGGHVRWLSTLPGLAEWAQVIEYRIDRLERQGNVTMELGTRVNSDRLLDVDAEYVVIATGSHWSEAGLNGFTREPLLAADADGSRVLTPEDVALRGRRPDGERVIIYDCEGYVVGPAVSELLADEGYAVSLLTPFSSISPMSWTLETALLRRHLKAMGVVERTEVILETIDGVEWHGRSVLGDPISDTADAFILVTQRVSDDVLYRGFQGSREPDRLPQMYQAGDCVTPRMLSDAVFDGHRIGRKIDGRDVALAREDRRWRSDRAHDEVESLA